MREREKLNFIDLFFYSNGVSQFAMRLEINIF